MSTNDTLRLVSELAQLTQRLESLKIQRDTLDATTEAVKRRMAVIVETVTPDPYTISRLSELIGRSRTWLAVITGPYRNN